MMLAFYVNLSVTVSNTHAMRRTGKFSSQSAHFLFVSCHGVGSQKAHTFCVQFINAAFKNLTFGGELDQVVCNMLGFLPSQGFTLFLYII